MVSSWRPWEGPAQPVQQPQPQYHQQPSQPPQQHQQYQQSQHQPLSSGDTNRIHSYHSQPPLAQSMPGSHLPPQRSSAVLPGFSTLVTGPYRDENAVPSGNKSLPKCTPVPLPPRPMQHNPPTMQAPPPHYPPRPSMPTPQSSQQPAHSLAPRTTPVPVPYVPHYTGHQPHAHSQPAGHHTQTAPTHTPATQHPTPSTQQHQPAPHQQAQIHPSQAPRPAAAPAPTTAVPPPAPASTTAPTAKTSKKRKSDAIEENQSLPEIDDADPRLDVLTDSCNQVRRKILNFIESGQMKVGEFQNHIGVSSAGYQRFMKQSGPNAGLGSEVYERAHRFFNKRQLQGLKAAPAPKKARKSDDGTGKTGGSPSLDVSGITLPGEEDQAVQVFDTCDVVRKKIRAHLRKPDVTQAAFCREIAKSFPSERRVQSKQLNDFLSKSGPVSGNTSCVYYGSYVFFEKLRLKEGRPKDKMREETEKIHTQGMNTTDVMGHITCFGNERPVLDEYGRLSFVNDGSSGGFSRRRL